MPGPRPDRNLTAANGQRSAGTRAGAVRILTDRQVTQPSSFSNSLMSLITGSKPWRRISSALRSARPVSRTCAVTEVDDVGTGFLRHREERIEHRRIVDEWFVPDDRPVGQRGDRRLEMEDACGRDGDHVCAQRCDEATQLLDSVQVGPTAEPDVEGRADLQHVATVEGAGGADPGRVVSELGEAVVEAGRSRRAVTSCPAE